MFEAIHGSAPRMVEENRAQFADPSSIIKAASMLLNHIEYSEKSKKLDMALDICATYEKKLIITGRSNGATGEQFANYIMETLSDSRLLERWKNYQ
jgi:isocitrate dehydrogenase (NAD+)